MFNLTPWRKKQNGSGELTTRQHPLNRIRDEFDLLFDRFFGPGMYAPDDHPGWGLEMDDTGTEVVIRAEAPGFEVGDFDVHVHGDVLTIQATRKQEVGEKGKEDYSFSERRLQRSVTLPAGTDADKVEARYRNGVLELRMPKSPEAQPRRIEVKS